MRRGHVENGAPWLASMRPPQFAGESELGRIFEAEFAKLQ